MNLDRFRPLRGDGPAIARWGFVADVAPEPPQILALQPTPELVLLAHLTTPSGTVTSIVRRLDPGDVARCQLCPKAECAHVRGTCLVSVNGFVPEADAALYARPGSPAAAPIPNTRGASR